MSQSSDLGKEGEAHAAKYLEEKGFKILQRNWKCGKNEVDIIAETKDFIVFAEVKTRADGFFEPPANAVTREKQRSIIWAADTYINRYGIDKESRFDVITVIKKDDNFEIEHIPDAFYPTLR
jgi:putative endonuclease